MSKNKTSFIYIKSLSRSYLLMVLLVLNLLLPANSKIYFLEADFYQDKTQDKKIILGKGEIILSDKPVSRIAISDPNIVDVQILNEKEMFARAKQLGSATVLIWEKGKERPGRFEVQVWPDINFLTKQLQELDKNILVEYIPPNSSLSSSASQGQSGSSDPNAGGQSALGGAGAALGGQSASSTGSQITSGKIILKGDVENAEIIARALQVAGAYVGDQGIKIISQPGGQIVDGLAGRYDIYSNSDSQGGQSSQGSATAFGARDPIRFTSNRYANLSRGVIATTQKGSVISFLTVKDSAQISVAIRFYEISRSAARNLGFNAIGGGSTLQAGSFVGGNGISQTIGGISSIANLMDFMAGTGSTAPEFSLGHGSIAGGSFLAQAIGQGVTGVIFNPDNGIGAIIQALQERGEIKTLAEPNLVIANGEPASFLAGGEVPIIRSVFTAGGASQDVTYEPFGIKFSILPTLTSKDKIFLQLLPEIRDIDTDLSNLVVPPGSTSVRPPAFRTRRTQTQVELYSGQAFAISGLLREDNTRNLRKVPGVGDVPVLGGLFRSKSFRKGQTELLIVVSPVIVRPTDPNKISQLTKPETPYNEFNQLPPLKPHIDLMDEQGPDAKEPIDAGKYNNPTPGNINNMSSNDMQKENINVGELNQKKIKEKENKENIDAISIKKKDDRDAPPGRLYDKEKSNEPIIEIKANENSQVSDEDLKNQEPKTVQIKETLKNEEALKPNETKKSRWDEFKERVVKEFADNKKDDFDDSENQVLKQAQAEKKLKEEKLAETERIAKEEQAKLVQKAEAERIAKEEKQAKLTRKIEAEKLAKEKEQIELQNREKLLKQTWQTEMQKYAQAKEAMRLARERK